MESIIQRLSAGAINAGSGDQYIAGTGAAFGPTTSHTLGQLGRRLWIPPDQLVYKSSVGTLYGGGYRYVRLRSADSAPAIGQIAFWDTTVTNWQTAFQVTTDETLSSSAYGVLVAGIFINIITPGYYWFVQDAGMVPVKFAAALTGTPAIGNAVYVKGDNSATADVLEGSLSAPTVTDIALMQQRYLGTAIVLPVAGELKAVLLSDAIARRLP